MRTVLLACAVVVLSFGAAAVDAQPILCESTPSGGYRECRIGSSGTIRLVTEISERSCYEGVTWGTRSMGVVWVDRGCRATFAVNSARSESAKGRIVCESQKGDRVVCPADTSSGVVFSQQLGRAACVEGENWGVDEQREFVWVDQNCRAEFLLGGAAPAPRPPVNYETKITCESTNGKRTQCSADTSNGVQIVRQLDNASCGYGKEWGYDAKGVWVAKNCRAEFAVGGKPKAMARAVTCGSDGGRKTCPADTALGVALAKRLGGTCELNRTWGFDEQGIWTSDGCHATFALGGYRLPAGAVPANATKVMCESLDGKRADCAIDTGRGVGLIQQTSEATCVLNRTWGYGPEGIWVEGGCRAEFAVVK